MLTVISEPKRCPSRVETIWVKSEILDSNPARMPSERPLTIYIPENIEKRSEPLPVLYGLAPWTSAGRQQFDWQAFRESLCDRLDRLIMEKRMPPTIVVCPDLYTRFGGSQYINSDYLGRQGDFIVEELLPFIESRYPVTQKRGVFGRSSGGFGALRLAMDYPGVFSAVACHSGDMGFDTAFRKDLTDLCQGLSRVRGDVRRFLKDCWEAPKLSGRDVHLLMILGLAATYSPNLKNPIGFDLPVDWYDGTLNEEIWQKWLSHDPVHRIENYHEGLKRLDELFLDCGFKDQFLLHYGARQFHKKLELHGVRHLYEEFDDNHSGTSYRYDISLPRLAQAILS